MYISIFNLKNKPSSNLTNPLNSIDTNQYKQNPKLSDNAKTQQEELADMIGISVDTLNNYKKHTELVPELQEWVETGILAPLLLL